MLYDPNWQPSHVEIEEWRNILEIAADLIEKNGWCQGNLYKERRTFFGLGSVKHSYCILGAIEKVAPHDYVAVDKMHRALGHIAMWNDTKGRTKKEVVAKIRQVARS